MKALLILLLVFTSTTSEQKLESDFQYTNGVWGDGGKTPPAILAISTTPIV